MKKIKKLFIVGGCVSRDAFNLPSGSCYKVIDYVARTSFASLVGAPNILKTTIDSIDSKWQRRMVELDMSKGLLSKIESSDFDILILDFLSIRFNLAVDSKEECIYTVSTEFKKAKKDVNLKGVPRYSEKAFEWWCLGFEKFVETVRRKGVKVFISELYWTKEINEGTWGGRYSDEDIDNANEQLKKHYKAAKRIMPEAFFIEYPQHLLIANANHKWGAAPFHYTEGLYKYFLFKISDGYFPSDVKVRHKYFNDVVYKFPINWAENSVGNRSWMHHFISLRWLEREKNNFVIVRVLRSFYNYHCVKKKRNPYYNEMRGDHAAAIRMTVFLNFLERFTVDSFPAGVGLCKRLVKEEVRNLQDKRMYRAGHNHGLMVDLAILRLIKNNPEYKNSVDIEAVLQRSAETLDAMWYTSGLTKEHSVSYQEYNMPLAVEYFQLIKEMKLRSLSNIELDNILDETKRILGYALKLNGEYFPLGDSLRLPNLKLLNRIYHAPCTEANNPRALLEPYSNAEGSYSNNNFFIYRKNVGGRMIHFSATCCWDSHNHKQNDELHFCLDVDGVSIFDDPGYSGLAERRKVKLLKSEHAHTTITIEGEDWSAKKEADGTSSMTAHETEDGFYLLMIMERLSGHRVTREIELKHSGLFIKDKVTKLDDVFSKSDKKIKSRFVFSNGISCKLSKINEQTYAELLSGEHHIATLIYDNPKGAIDELQEQVPFVLADKAKVSESLSLAFVQQLRGDLETNYWVSFCD